MIPFILGVLSIIATALIVLFTISTIKVYKLQKEFERMNRDYHDLYNDFISRLDNTTRNLYDSMSRDRDNIFNMNDKIHSRLEQLEQKTKKKK